MLRCLSFFSDREELKDVYSLLKLLLVLYEKQATIGHYAHLQLIKVVIG